ncbi:integrase catalytic domain-containing protein [Trichonephila clavipes]|nr:integrase catalytic domain-containing protein [Trichonephila clavipes]
MDAANQAILEKAKKTRFVSRSLVTKQVNKPESEISNSADKTTIHEIYMQLISKSEELRTLDKEIKSLINIESLEDKIVSREEYREKFIICKIHAERYEESIWSISIQNSAEYQLKNITLPLNSIGSSALTNQPRLPKLTLESFSGKYIGSFPKFLARSVVHEKMSLNDVDKFSYLKSVVTFDVELAIRGLTLMPENYAKAVKILEDRFGLETSLGWSLQGKCDERSDCTSVHLVHSEEESISAELKRFWEIESLRILDKTLGSGDEELIRDFDKSVSFVDGGYRVSLLWKPGMREALQNNKTVAQGIVERTSCDSLSDNQGFYLPHHAVMRSDKTASRIRIVFDGSAHEDRRSTKRFIDVEPKFILWTKFASQHFRTALTVLKKSCCAFTADRTNSEQLYLLWQQEGIETEFSETSAINLIPPIKVLGLASDPKKDLIYFDPKDLSKFMSCRGESKRFILSVHCIFDPIGILGSFVIELQCLLLDLWTLGVHWDSELPPKLRHK